MTNKKGNKINKEISISKSLDELIEMKKHENSALKKIFNSLKNPEKKKANQI